MTQGPERGVPRVSPPQAADVPESARWTTDGAMRRRYASWTGDYNGLHQWDWYARWLGFEAASAHPQHVAVQCLARIARPVHGPQQLDLWLKGPVRYGASVCMREAWQADDGGVGFSLTVDSSPRPALVGHWSPLRPDRP
jgi:acyl dehydratase